MIKDPYDASKDNQKFMHARPSPSDDVLKPYKATIDRWLWPDLLKNQQTSVANAKKAVSDYKNAIGDPPAVAELMLFYCERAAEFSNDVGFHDEGYFIALIRMFEQALKNIVHLPESDRVDLLDRLEIVRRISHSIGYGVGDDTDDLLEKCTSD